MTGTLYTKAWLVVQSLLLISAMDGVEFTYIHSGLAVLCLGYNAAVYWAVRRGEK